MYSNFDELRENCLNCRECGLCETRHNVVVGVGNPKASVMFIGEGPGENEDLQGEPFVGRGGKLLDKMLTAVDLDRKKNIYIGLRNQVTLIKPKIIVCLGRISAQKLIKPDLKITKEHGMFFKKGNYLMMPMFHPAAILRNPNQKPDAFADFLTLQKKIMEICPETYTDLG